MFHLANFTRKVAASSIKLVRTISDAPHFEKSMNKVYLLGRAGNNPEIRGHEERPVTIFTLATNTRYRDEAGEYHQKSEWHRVSVFRPHLRDTVFNHLRKGQRCLVQGRLSYGRITDAQGHAHTTASVVADEVIFFSRSRATEFDEREDANEEYFDADIETKPATGER